MYGEVALLSYNKTRCDTTLIDLAALGDKICYAYSGYNLLVAIISLVKVYDEIKVRLEARTIILDN